MYRALARLRRTHPDLTDPRFDRVDCTVDEDTRLFRMRRGALEIVVNFGDSPLTVPLRDATDLLFATGDGVTVDRTSSLTLPRSRRRPPPLTRRRWWRQDR